MKKKNIAIGLLATAVCASSTMALSGCGNMKIIDTNYTMKYIVVEENNLHILHEITTWSDSSSESVTYSCPKCNNYSWASVNNAVVYRDKPAKYAYDYECCDSELER